MRADFKAVETFGKIAMHVLHRRVPMRVSFWITTLPEFIHLAAIAGARDLQDLLDHGFQIPLPRRFATRDEMLLRPN
jgi:hypothetical protein